ncbi:hypothetical protein ACG74X_19355 [Marivita sp. S0852]|uniref:hypothetical protein n=1 Tax=Marivita sp. S0852 TaxID=3373893 RepID=UPI003982272C
MDVKTFVAALEKRQLLRLRGSWSWLIADRTGDFQEFLGRPMTKWDAIRRRTKAFIGAEKLVPTDGPNQPIADLMRDLLLGLAAEGEDVPRMLIWAMSLDATLLPGSKPDYWKGAPTDWDEEISSWKHLPEGSAHRQLYDSFKREVLLPAKRIRTVPGAGYYDDDWCEDPSLRSEWDQVLWDWFLSRVWIDPIVYAAQGYDKMLRREWWRRWRERLGPEKAAEIGAPLEGRRGTPHSLDEIMSIDLLPPFETVAAPPVGS